MRFAPERDYGPFVYAEADGQIQGMSVDLLAAMAPRAGLQVKILPPRDLADILEGVKAGEVDLVSSLRPNPERSRFLGFSAPYVEVPAVLVLRKGETRRLGLADFRQRRVGVGKAYALEAFVRQRYPEVQWEAQANDAVALRALAAGQLDGVVADAASVAFIQRRERLSGIEVHEAVGFQYALSFAYPIQRADLGDALARGLRDLPRAERDLIVRRWMDLDALSYRPPQLSGVQRGIGGLALLAGVLGLVLLLKRCSAARAKHD
ncbi:transporter substrate-binding domain-containing protein [Roseateles puraquae]|uniref:transporter substrate-binding domain-containing protein n=1 Tax=Roseateles puraquae TaxID=431059 RepID=UPI0031DDAE45